MPHRRGPVNDQYRPARTPALNRPSRLGQASRCPTPRNVRMCPARTSSARHSRKIRRPPREQPSTGASSVRARRSQHHVPSITKPRAISSRGSPSCWRRGWDSNPRETCAPIRFPGVPDRPLQHLSARAKGYRSKVSATVPAQGTRAGIAQVERQAVRGTFPNELRALCSSLLAGRTATVSGRTRGLGTRASSTAFADSSSSRRTAPTLHRTLGPPRAGPRPPCLSPCP